MGRKSYEGTGVLPGIDEPVREAPDESLSKAASSRRSASPKGSGKSARTARFSTPRLVVLFVSAVVILGAILYAFHVGEQFLIMDSRFALGAGEDSSLQITGAAHASRPAIEKIFADDQDGSVYLIPLAERRDAIR